MKIYPFTILTASLCVANNPFMCVAQDVPSGFATDETPSSTPVEDVGSSDSLLDSSSSTVSYASTPVPGVAASSGSSAVTGEVEALASYGGDDPNFILPNQPVESVLGFSKTPLETPRSISVISSELISSLSLNDVQDLTKVAPNTFTTTRWGVQGNIDIRNTTADTYFRGMKRIEPQGNSRTTLGSNDQIEIVRGAPAPYLGPGKIGGYSNLTPKSGRSKQGKYLEAPTGFFQAIYGSFERQEVSFGYGGPMKLLGDDLKGGFYVYGLMDDSETYYQHVPANQKILQAALSQDLPNGWRLETGFNLQRSQTAGGFLNRVNQELVSNQLYWSGQRLVNLDTDNSGKISQRELELNSPTLNRRLSAANRPLHQRWDNRYMSVLNGTAPDVDMANAPVNSALAAIMKTSLAPMIDQQTANLLALLPQGFPLDPATMKQVKADFSAVALERELQADLGLFYLDLIKDDFDDLRVKNQLFFDLQDQFKDSELNYYQKQDVYVMEEKFTVEKTFSDTPEWLDNLAVIFSPNIRHTHAQIHNNTGDYDDSPDLGLPGNVRTPNDLFLSPRENDDYFNEGAFYTNFRRSTFTEFGVGALIDATFLEKANLTTGARVDYIDARTTDLAGVYSVTSGTVDDPLARRQNQDLKAQGGDLGLSYSASFSYELPKNIRPYITYAEQSTLMDGSSITITRPTVNAGAYEKATLKEVGVKGSFLDDKLFATLAGYRQQRSSFTDDVGGAVVTSVLGEGIEMELKWAPRKDFYASLFGVVQQTYLIQPNNQWTRIHGEQLGFRDIVDASGTVVYPAEAFTWGGRAEFNVPDGVNQEHPGYPNTQVGFNTAYTFPFGLSIGGSAAYTAEVHSGRFQAVRLPESFVLDFNIAYKVAGWRVQFDIMNANNEQFFRGRNGTFAGDVLISAMQPRRYQLTLSKTF